MLDLTVALTSTLAPMLMFTRALGDSAVASLQAALVSRFVIRLGQVGLVIDHLETALQLVEV